MPVYFRQARYFYYLTGLDLPDFVVAYNIELDKLVLFMPLPKTGRSVLYNGQNPTPKEIQEKYDFDSIMMISALPAYVNYFAHREKGLIYVVHPYHITKGAIPQHFTFSDGYQSSLYISPWETTKLKPAMDSARVIKSPYEIKMIRKANFISGEAHTNVLRQIKNLGNETEVEAIYTATCIAAHAKRQAYGVIAGSGENISTLHYVANKDPLSGRQLLCLDAGCEWDCYASDVTRTFPTSGKFTPEAKAIYDLVDEMQSEAIKMCKPGANYINIHLQSLRIATRGLMTLGIIQNGSEEELFKSGVTVAFFPHGVSPFPIPLPRSMLTPLPSLAITWGSRCTTQDTTATPSTAWTRSPGQRTSTSCFKTPALRQCWSLTWS
jgi:Xaa-Pro dipeptidase